MLSYTMFSLFGPTNPTKTRSKPCQRYMTAAVGPMTTPSTIPSTRWRSGSGRCSSKREPTIGVVGKTPPTSSRVLSQGRDFQKHSINNHAKCAVPLNSALDFTPTPPPPGAL